VISHILPKFDIFENTVKKQVSQRKTYLEECITSFFCNMKTIYHSQISCDIIIMKGAVSAVGYLCHFVIVNKMEAALYNIWPCSRFWFVIFFLLEQITWYHVDAAATTAVLLCNPKFCAIGM
jgi:hypothetical protein